MNNWGIRKQVLTLALLPAAIIAVLLTTTFIVSQISEHTKLLEEKGRILTSQLAVAAEYAVATGNISILENLTSSVLKEPDVAQINITDKEHIEILCTASIEGKTGVEMEALTGANIAALTVYDMCKAISQEMIIKEVKLVKKFGGKNDFKL